MNNGKRFEQNFKKSVPDDIFLYRLKDGSASWGGTEKVRFQPTNICDFIMHDGEYLYFLELKSTKGKSLPFSNIKKHQVEDLLWASSYANVVAGFLIEFSDLKEVYFLEINRYKRFLHDCNRMSIPLDYLAKNGIKIDVEKKKVNCTYNIEKMIDDIVREII